MGHYTRFHFSAPIVHEDQMLLHWLRDVCDPDKEMPDPFNSHDFFDHDRWRQIFWGSGGLGDLARDPSFLMPQQRPSYRDEAELVLNSLILKSSLKNASQRMLRDFIDWISQYVEAESGTFLGYSVYEESRSQGVTGDGVIEVPEFYYLGYGPFDGPTITSQSSDPPF